MLHPIRSATIDDVPRLAALWEHMVRLHADLDDRLRFAADAAATYAQHLARHVPVPEAWIRVITRQGDVQAFCFTSLSQAPPVFRDRRQGLLHDLAVDDAWRSQGMGTALVQDAVAWCTQRGAGCMEARVAVANTRAAAFWARHGFTPLIAVHRRALPA